MTVLSKKNISKNFKLIHFITVLCLLFSSCKKDPSIIGLSLQDDADIINGQTIDTITIKAYTFREDSLSTDERSLSLLGSYTDPVFGFVNASFVTQMKLASSNVSFGSSPVADSIVVYLDYKSFYGDTTIVQNIKIYEIEKSIYLDSTYYSNLNMAPYIPNQKIIGTISFLPRPNDSCLAIKLSDAFAQHIISASSTDLTNNDNFIKFFKGFYFEAQPVASNGAILYFNLLSRKSKVTLYYKNSEGSKKYDFVFNNTCARINLFSHDYTNSSIHSINDSTANDSLLYLHAMSGLNVKIKFPYIKEYAKQNLLAFVKAELIIPVHNDAFSNTYKAPLKLLLAALKSDGTYEFLPDYFVNTTYFGGQGNSGLTEYRFNISRYLQQLAYTNKQDFGIVLFVSDNRVSANRVIIKGPTAQNKMRVSLTYLKP
ncbi:MAG: DUF4270 domain-containing protein [Bacteroidales bacterium]|nr:DUF4270 domain-containing protein [Bacteroidales bacterium]